MKRFIPLFVFYFMLGCSKTPEPINYGTDACQHCKMTIVARTHAAQIVTSKGKQFKFDAIECMIGFLGNKQELKQASNLLISNFLNPGEMVDAKTGGYVICEKIKSPMGANLTGFASLEQAKTKINDPKAAFYDWEGIFKKLN